ncbi:MAG: hypothetical protein U9N02_04700 [Campylobacterota bacterium]|nr:hypothetical protein [Campylobacterota bacterium]
MGKYGIYVVFLSLLVLASVIYISEDDKKEIVAKQKQSIKDKVVIKEVSKIKIITIDADIVKTTNLTKNKIELKKDTKKRFIITNISSRKGLFQISLFSYEELNPKNENFAIGGSVDFEEFKDFYSLRFNEELLKYADKLYVEVTYNTKVFKTNAFRLYEIDKKYLYGVDMHLEDDFINLHPYELSKRTKFKLEDIIPKDINLTHHMDNTTIESDNIKELNFIIQK